MCAFVCAFLCVPMCLCVCLYLRLCAQICECVFVPVSLNVSVCLHVCWCVSVWALVCQGSWSFQAGSATPKDCPLPRASALEGRGKNFSSHHSTFVWVFIYKLPRSTNNRRWRSWIACGSPLDMHGGCPLRLTSGTQNNLISFSD